MERRYFSSPSLSLYFLIDFVWCDDSIYYVSVSEWSAHKFYRLKDNINTNSDKSRLRRNTNISNADAFNEFDNRKSFVVCEYFFFPSIFNLKAKQKKENQINWIKKKKPTNSRLWSNRILVYLEHGNQWEEFFFSQCVVAVHFWKTTYMF